MSKRQAPCLKLMTPPPPQGGATSPASLGREEVYSAAFTSAAGAAMPPRAKMASISAGL